jgi:hypothetical protein
VSGIFASSSPRREDVREEVHAGIDIGVFHAIENTLSGIGIVPCFLSERKEHIRSGSIVLSTTLREIVLIRAVGRSMNAAIVKALSIHRLIASTH